MFSLRLSLPFVNATVSYMDYQHVIDIQRWCQVGNIYAVFNFSHRIAAASEIWGQPRFHFNCGRGGFRGIPSCQWKHSISWFYANVLRRLITFPKYISTEISCYVHNKNIPLKILVPHLVCSFVFLAVLALATESTSASVRVANRGFGCRGAGSWCFNGAGAGTAGSPVAMDASGWGASKISAKHPPGPV